ncbi:hypothetical protein ABKN59_004653 [Abortiporus biennis]
MEANDDLHGDNPLMTMSNTFLGESMLSLSIPGPTRDPVYYIHDGNSVLLVENTLFKVHRSTLTKDQSAFETMFQISSEADTSKSDSSMTAAPEGGDDANPIRLQGDTADEFRALLWALYALPHELTIAMTPEANPTQLLNLTRITHKYHFRGIMKWALDALNTYYSYPGALDALPTVNPPVLPHPHPHHSDSLSPSLSQLTELAALCERSDLLNTIVQRWKRQVGEGKDLALAINIGERFNLRSLLGIAYHAMMLKGKPHWDSEQALTREQKIRLLSGYYNLAKLWETLSSQPPTLQHSARCTSQQRCTKAWGALWGNILDMLESIMKAMVEKEILSPSVTDSMPHCRESAIFASSMKLREVKEGLADYFSDEF